MPASLTALAALEREQPVWSPWLRVVGEAVREAPSGWDTAVSSGATPAPQLNAPLLTGAIVSVPESAIRGLVKRLIRAAANGGTPGMRTFEAIRAADLDVFALFTASVCQDRERLIEIAGLHRADEEAFEAVMALIALPFLHACRRRWAPLLSPAWTAGCCPLCGSWPAFAEMRGIERSRHFRCGRCAGEWHSRLLCCPYCASTNHDALVTLVPEKAGARCAIEACKECLGYVKIFTRLQGCPPDEVIVDDLATVALDVAALEEGYSRPAGSAIPLGIVVTDGRPARGRFAWNT